MAFLIDQLLDSALNSSIVVEDLVTKTSIARSALDYLKMTKDEEEEKQTFFEMEALKPKSLIEEIESIKGDIENGN